MTQNKEALEWVDDAFEDIDDSRVRLRKSDPILDRAERCLKTIRAALQDDWQDMVNAPEDGTVVLLWVEGFGVRTSSYGICYTQHDGYIANNGKPCWRAEGNPHKMQPIRNKKWKPLPKPPRGENDE